MDANIKKVLIITYYWPPSGGAGVQRWLKFSKYLRDFGWEPVIFTPENPEAGFNDPSLIKDVREDITVVKTKIWEPFTLYKKLTGRKKSDSLGAGFLSEKQTPSSAEKLSTWVRGNLFIPDARRFWIKPSIRFLKKYLKEHPVDIIVSTGPPHSMHMIALELKKSLGISWIADFRDPWTDIDFYDKLKLTKWADKRHHALERSVFKNADKVVSVSWSWAHDYEQKGAKDVEIITNGYDPDDFHNIIVSEETDNFTICQFGSVNKDRNHDIFWRAISEVIDEDEEVGKKLKVLFIGSLDFSVSDSISKYKLDSVVEKVGYLSHSKVIELACQTDILYLPLNNTRNISGIIPGKIFEYLALKKPILCIGNINGDSARIINETKSGVVFDFENGSEIKKWIFNAFYKKKVLKNLYNSSYNVEKYSRITLTEQMASLFNSMVTKD